VINNELVQKLIEEGRASIEAKAAAAEAEQQEQAEREQAEIAASWEEPIHRAVAAGHLPAELAGAVRPGGIYGAGRESHAGIKIGELWIWMEIDTYDEEVAFAARGCLVSDEFGPAQLEWAGYPYYQHTFAEALAIASENAAEAWARWGTKARACTHPEPAPKSAIYWIRRAEDYALTDEGAASTYAQIALVKLLAQVVDGSAITTRGINEY
jgi:hypothetical protein